MTKQETIDRWADSIIPAVFRAKDALKKAKPEWIERLRNVNEVTAHDVAKQYCREIAEIIVSATYH